MENAVDGGEMTNTGYDFRDQCDPVRTKISWQLSLNKCDQE